MSTHKSEVRKLERLTNIIFSKKAIRHHFDHEEFKAIGFINHLRRELKLSNGATAYLTAKAETAFREVIEKTIDILQPSKEFDDNDIYKVCKEILIEVHSSEALKINAQEFIDRALEKLRLLVRDHFFAVIITGIELDEIEAYEIKGLTIRKADRTILDECRNDPERIEHVWKKMQGRTWLTGVVSGSQNYAQKLFFEHARKFSSVIAIAVASESRWGASNIRIEPNIEGARSGGPATWFSYPHDTKAIRVSWTYGQLSPTLVTNEILNDLDHNTDWFSPLLELLLKSPTTETESAIHRAIYWFYDAQADHTHEMRFVKFWSCVECFFSFESTKTTSSIIDGLSSVLVYGGYHFIEPDKETVLRRRINSLYELRSQSVHDARHGHVTERDVADISQWTAWLIITMLKLSESGYKTRAQIKEVTDRLCSRRRVIMQPPPTKDILLNKKDTLSVKLKSLRVELRSIDEALKKFDQN